MVQRLAAWWLTIVLLSGLCRAAPQVRPVDPYSMTKTLEVMHQPGVSVTISWQRCHELNASYNSQTKAVVLCSELITAGLSPAVIRFITAHELAHAIIRQKDIPYTTLHEAAADELAAVLMIEGGHESDVVAAALWFDGLDPTEDPADEHTSNARRAFSLACLYAGYQDPNTLCRATWLHAAAAWKKLLSL